VTGVAATVTPTRVRLRFTKTGKVRWTSHRDVARMWERALRRVGLALAYSAGFSPRPKVSFGLALPTGHESSAEYLDLELVEVPTDLAATAAALTTALPAGLAVTAAEVIDRSEPSLQEAVTFCTWRWAVAGGAGAEAVLADLDTAVKGLLARDELIVTRTRKGREHVEDIRASILDLWILPEPPADAEPLGDASPPVRWLRADLASQPRSIRPLEVLHALDPALDERQVRRLNQWILRDGARREPLVPIWAPAGLGPDRGHPAPGPGPVAATGAPHALGRAS
jgi:radical SAM-linked protein